MNPLFPHTFPYGRDEEKGDFLIFFKLKTALYDKKDPHIHSTDSSKHNG